MRKRRKAKPWSVSKVLETIKQLVVLFGSLSAFFGWAYFSFMVTPQIKWLPSTPSEDHFKAQQGDYRSLEAYLRAQIIVCYGDYQVLSTYVDGYYENEHVVFIGEDGVAKLTDPAIAQELLFYIRQGILDRLEEACGEGAVRESDLDVHISTLGGIKYINELANQENQHCIIKEDGAVLDYDEEAQVIEDRLFEYAIDFPDDADSIPRDKKIETLIQTVSEHIAENLLGKAERKGAGLLWYVLWFMAAAAGLVLAYKVCRRWHREIADALKRLLGRLRGLKPLARATLIVTAACIIIPLGTFVAKAAIRTRDERLNYEKLEIGHQQPKSVLFGPEQPKEPVPSAEPESWPAQAVMNRLHIPKKFVGIKINEVTLGYYDGLFEGIYQNGTNNMPESAILPDWFGLENEPYASLGQAAAGLPEEERAGTVYGVIETEADKWPISRRPAALYHVSRVLTDTVLNHPELDFETLFDIAADGVALGEKFLSYRNRNIEEREKDILNGENIVPDAKSVKNAEDIALKNGKVYWALANDVEVLETLQKYKGYAPCLWAAGYKCMEWGRKQTTQDDPEYAKMTYYLGNLGERMLPYIPQGELHESVGTAALGYYYEAQDLLENGGGIYRVEDNMADNIQSGIDTLEGMGFVYEPEEQ